MFSEVRSLSLLFVIKFMDRFMSVFLIGLRDNGFVDWIEYNLLIIYMMWMFKIFILEKEGNGYY